MRSRSTDPEHLSTQRFSTHRRSFDPQRAGDRVGRGNSARVLTRRERVVQRDARDRATQDETQSIWDTVRIAQTCHGLGVHPVRPPSLERPVNRTGLVADAVLKLAAPLLHTNAHTYRLAMRDEHMVAPPLNNARTHAAVAARFEPGARTFAPGADTFSATLTRRDRHVDVGTINGSSEHPGTLAEHATARWIAHGCAAITQIGRVARGLGWSAMQATLSRLAFPECQVNVGAHNASVNLELLSDGCVVNRLGPPSATTVQAMALHGDAGTHVADASDTDAADISRHRRARNGPHKPVTRHARRGAHEPVTRHARYLSGWHSPIVQAAINSVRVGFSPSDRDAMVAGYSRLSARLDEFLQGPCGTLVRIVLDSANPAQELGAQAMTSNVCDLLYQATPVGAAGSTFGYLLQMASKLRSNEPMSAEDVERGYGYLSIKPNIDGIVQAGRRSMLWTREGLVAFEPTQSGKGVIRTAQTAKHDEAFASLPVEHSPEGWRLSSIPAAYRVKAHVTDLLEAPHAQVRTGPASAYVKVDDAVYEARQDARSTRWRIVPPEGRQGLSIAIEYDAKASRWQAIRLLGAGDTPALSERYAARDAELRTGPEGDVYVDAHGQEYDASLLPEAAGTMSLEALTLMWIETTQMTPRQLGVLHQYIELRRWDHLSARVRENVRLATETSEGAAAFARGAHHGDSRRMPGHHARMSPLELLERAAHGNLDAFELGAGTTQLAERIVITRVHQEVQRILQSATHSMLGALRWDRVRVPGVDAHTSYESLLTTFLYDEMTEVQRGALRPRIHASAGSAYGDTVALSHRISSARSSGVPEHDTGFTYGYEHYLEFPIDAQTSLDAAIRMAMQAADNPTELGALWRHVEIMQREVEELSHDFKLAIERIDHGHEPFRAGFDNAWSVELPPTGYGSAVELAELFFREPLSLLQQGAVFGRLRESELMAAVHAHVDTQRREGNGARLAYGYAQPGSYPVPGLPGALTLDEIVARLDQGALMPEQVGRLHYEADQLAHAQRESRVDVIRHQLVTGPQFGEYLDGYLNPDSPAQDPLPLETLATFGNELLLDMFRHDASGARERGRIAYRLTVLEAEQRQRDIFLIRRTFLNADARARVEFPQTDIPRMLHGLLDGSCFALSAAMSVAMSRGAPAIETFVARIRGTIAMVDPLPGQAAGRRQLSPELRNVVAGLASLSVRQPDSPGELIANELVPFPEPYAWQDLHTLFSEAASDGVSDYMIVTRRHAIACRIEAVPGALRGVLYHFYEPNYGLLTFDRLRALRVAIENAFTTSYYQTNVLGGSPMVDVYLVDPERLSRVRIRGRLTVGDLVDPRPFMRSRLSVVQAPGETADAGTQTDPLAEEREDDASPDGLDDPVAPSVIDASTQTELRIRPRRERSSRHQAVRPANRATT